MKRFVITAGLFLFAGSAFAADMAVKAPPAPPTPVSNWTGFYIGGSVGGAWSRNQTSQGQGLTAVGGLPFSPLLPFNTNATSIIGGPQIGYNLQFAPQWVAGLEADFDWTKLNGSQTYNPIPPGIGGAAIPPSFMTMGRDIDWLGSVRGRLGYTWNSLLLYGTAGVAWSKVGFLGIDSRQGGAFGETTSLSVTKAGWVAGGGLEYLVSKNWSGRIQFLHYSFAGVSAFGVPSSLPAVDNFSWGRTQVNSLTVGLNYRLNN
jgi:outer membrane immunogenic protein